MVNSGALSGAFLVVVFCRLWAILVLFLVLFWWSCFVDCGQFWCSFWCFSGGRVLQIVGHSGALSGAFLVVVFCRLWAILVLFLALFWWSCFVDCGQFWCSFWRFSGGRVLQIVGNSGALSGAFLVLVFCRLWPILVLFLVLFWWSCVVDCGQFWCSFWCFSGGRVL